MNIGDARLSVGHSAGRLNTGNKSEAMWNIGLLNRPCFHYIEIGERSLIQGPVRILIATEFAALSTPPLVRRVMPVVRSRLPYTLDRERQLLHVQRRTDVMKIDAMARILENGRIDRGRRR